jgi:carboxypeptidase family protein
MATVGTLLSLSASIAFGTTCVEVAGPLKLHHVSGVVLFRSGDRIPNAKVVILQNGHEIAAQQSAKDGQFEFEGLLAGNYEITVQVEGVGAARTQILLTKPQPRSKNLLGVYMNPNGICSSIFLVKPKQLR